jgi:hypothetical protein
MRKAPERLVFIDETAVKTNLTRMCGLSPKGERLNAAAPFGSWNTQTFIAGLTCDGMIAPWGIKGATDGAAYENYIRTQLVPALEPRTVVILDNLATHKNVAAAEALKAHLRRIGTRTFDQLFEAIGDICAMFTPEECWNYLQAAGYA